MKSQKKMDKITMKLRGKAKPKPTDWRGAKRYISVNSFFDTPTYFSEWLCKNMPVATGKKRLLDVGCGSGIVGIYCLLKHKADFVTFADIECKAISETCSNVVKRVERDQISVKHVAFLEPSEFRKIPRSIVMKHDLIAFNPPQIPEKLLSKAKLKELRADPLTSHFRAGGPDGLRLAREFFQWYARLRKPRPAAVIELSSLIGKGLIDKTIREYGLTYDIVGRPKRVKLRPFFWPKVGALGNEDRKDRSLRCKNGKWTKVLTTYSLGRN